MQVTFGDPCLDFFGDGKEKEVSAIFDSISKLNQAESRRLTMAKKASKTTTVTEMLDWMFDPANGKVGIKVTVPDRKTGKPKEIQTTGFHAVNSGFNDAVRRVLDVKDIIEFWNQAKAKKLCRTKPVKGGIMVYPYSETSNKGDSLLAEMAS